MYMENSSILFSEWLINFVRIGLNYEDILKINKLSDYYLA